MAAMALSSLMYPVSAQHSRPQLSSNYGDMPGVTAEQYTDRREVLLVQLLAHHAEALQESCCCWHVDVPMGASLCSTAAPLPPDQPRTHRVCWKGLQGRQVFAYADQASPCLLRTTEHDCCSCVGALKSTHTGARSQASLWSLPACVPDHLCCPRAQVVQQCCS